MEDVYETEIEAIVALITRALTDARRQVWEDAANFVATDNLCIGAGRRQISAYLRQRAAAEEPQG